MSWKVWGSVGNVQKNKKEKKRHKNLGGIYMKKH
jgi:hypothetical protein